jgi:hypothetical protein
MLKPPLWLFPDETQHGGSPGHFSIAPANTKGDVDAKSLADWAMSRGSGHVHELTQMLLDAVVEPNAKGSAT